MRVFDFCYAAYLSWCYFLVSRSPCWIINGTKFEKSQSMRLLSLAFSSFTEVFWDQRLSDLTGGNNLNVLLAANVCDIPHWVDWIQFSYVRSVTLLQSGTGSQKSKQLHVSKIKASICLFKFSAQTSSDLCMTICKHLCETTISPTYNRLPDRELPKNIGFMDLMTRLREWTFKIKWDCLWNAVEFASWTGAYKPLNYCKFLPLEILPDLNLLASK